MTLIIFSCYNKTTTMNWQFLPYLKAGILVDRTILDFAVKRSYQKLKMYKVVLLCLLVQVAHSAVLQFPRGLTPESCASNSYFVSCFSPICEPRCNSPTPMHCLYPKVPQTPCFPGCMCSYGYYRNAENNCVSSFECASPQAHEELDLF